jgi:hypothetical protein
MPRGGGVQDLAAPKPAVLLRFHIAKFELALSGLIPAPPPASTPAARLPERHAPTARMLLRVERAHAAIQEDWLPPPRNNEQLMQLEVGWLDILSFPASATESPKVRPQPDPHPHPHTTYPAIKT